MKTVIQKFGGTSVATEDARQKAAQKIIQQKITGVLPVVVVSAIGREGSPYATDTLLEFVNQTSGEMSDREYDLLLSCGEIISAVTLATLLNNKGYKSVALTGGQGGIITNDCHKKADLLYVKTATILDYLKKGIIPIVAGFQGMTEEGEITTIGRGGSDTTAAILGMALKSEKIEVYTDVDGIMTADPRVCDKAQIISSITYAEVFQMADSGAKVIHPKAVEYARRGNIPLVIKNTFSEAEGTYITENMSGQLNHKIITSVVHSPGRVQFIIKKDSDKREILELIAEENISIDLINIFPTRKLFTVSKEYKKRLEEKLQDNGYDYSIVENCCKITVVGERMTGVPGVMSLIVNTFNKQDIEILQTADSLSTIGCLINEENVARAVNALHDAFGLS